MNKITVEQRVKRALERYPFLDEYTLEEVFEALIKLREVNISTACKALDDFGFSDEELINFYKAWLESDTILVDKKPMCDAVVVGDQKLEFIVIDTEAMAWGKGDSIPEAVTSLSKTKNDFTSLDSDNIQIWLVSAGTTVSGVGSFNYSVDFIHPTRIK